MLFKLARFLRNICEFIKQDHNVEVPGRRFFAYAFCRVLDYLRACTVRVHANAEGKIYHRRMLSLDDFFIFLGQVFS